ncbi:hypothetical protein A9Q99_11295 [Gammaproteobacteria bacterium 45_16_T64]|nr:hypothetical protein A9Q99_11295 [Gammaproteobacteria bacterium 45_16_T64]
MTLMPGPSDNIPSASAETLSASQLLSDPPGATLRKARDARKLDLETAADQLNLSASVVRALEEDAYDSLPSPTFIRGYIRCYARLLRLSGDDLVRSYERIEALNQPSADIEGVEASEVTSGGWLRWVLVSVVVGTILVGTIWVQGNEPASGVLESASNEQEIELVDQNAASSVNSVEVEPMVQEIAAIDLVEDPGLAVKEPAVAPEAVTTVDTEFVQPSVVQAPVVNEQQVVELTPVMVDMPVAAIDVPEASLAEITVEPVAAIPTTALSTSTISTVSMPEKSSITMKFNGECWVEVWDASGQRIYANLRQAGHLVSLKGVAPIEVKLGNGSAVKLEFNGNPVLFASSKRTGVAHVTLSPEVH